jgi:hypothetical protein
MVGNITLYRTWYDMYLDQCSSLFPTEGFRLCTLS